MSISFKGNTAGGAAPPATRMPKYVYVTASTAIDVTEDLFVYVEAAGQIDISITGVEPVDGEYIPRVTIAAGNGYDATFHIVPDVYGFACFNPEGNQFNILRCQGANGQVTLFRIASQWYVESMTGSWLLIYEP